MNCVLSTWRIVNRINRRLQDYQDGIGLVFKWQQLYCEFYKFCYNVIDLGIGRKCIGRKVTLPTWTIIQVQDCNVEMASDLPTYGYRCLETPYFTYSHVYRAHTDAEDHQQGLQTKLKHAAQQSHATWCKFPNTPHNHVLSNSKCKQVILYHTSQPSFCDIKMKLYCNYLNFPWPTTRVFFHFY